MSFNLFGKKKDSFDKKAENLVSIAKAAALSYYTPCENKFPLVFNIQPDHWYAVLTVANCSFAVIRLLYSREVDAAIPHKRKIELHELILRKLDAKQPEFGAQAVDDCLKFLKKSCDDGRFDGAEYKQDPGLVRVDAFGIWSFLNLMGRVPGSAEEFGLARVIGGLLQRYFYDYWEEKS